MNPFKLILSLLSMSAVLLLGTESSLGSEQTFAASANTAGGANDCSADSPDFQKMSLME